MSLSEHAPAISSMCKKCRIGSCCYEGVELSAQELKTIVKFQPRVPKPWFRKLSPSEITDERHTFTTLVRHGTCVFQDKHNRCLIYPVRPDLCRQFPMENTDSRINKKTITEAVLPTPATNFDNKTSTVIDALVGHSAAPYFSRLCVLFHRDWAAASLMKRNLVKREGVHLEKKLQEIEKNIDFAKPL